jgi:Icc protein
MQAPVCALPGNHDDDLLMRQFFPQGPWNGPLVLQVGAWQLILLKSSVAGRIGGSVAPDDLQRLRRRLDTGRKRPVLLALHHHPVAVGSPWIDRHMLQAPDALLQLVADHEQIRAVVWGHVHQAFASQLGQSRLLACPSTAANSLAGTARFVHDPAGPACRWLLLDAQGNIETGLLYAD